MDKNRIKGKVVETEGKLQKAKGRITGSTTDKVEGSAKEAEGKIRNAVGRGKDSIRKSMK
jgi:uncharacterized protein YjbJ (UPF0337 family)